MEKFSLGNNLVKGKKEPTPFDLKKLDKMGIQKYTKKVKKGKNKKALRKENTMSGNSRKLFDNLVSRTKIYLVIIFLLLVIVSYLKVSLIIPSIIIYALVLGYTYFANNKRKSEISEQLQDLTLTVDSAAKVAL